MYSMMNFKVKKGDEVTIILTNHDKVEDLTHGFAIPKYDICFIVNPQQTASVTFHCRQAGCVLVLLHPLLPRAASGNAQHHVC
jgi:nitrous-oxide reductase